MLPPVDALELLGSKFPHKNVREFAVSCLENVPTYDLIDYLPQLVQVCDI